jgi:hypothetical protein
MVTRHRKNTRKGMSTDLSDTIEQFNQFDIKNSHVSYEKWLKSKLTKKNTSVSQEPPKKNGEEVFKSWLSRKKQEAQVEKAKKNQELQLKLEKEKAQLDIALKKQRLSSLKFQEWKKQKHLLQKSRESSEIAEKINQQKKSKETSQVSKKIVENYWKTLDKRPSSSCYPHKTAWVDSCPLDGKPKNTVNGKSTEFSKKAPQKKTRKSSKQLEKSESKSSSNCISKADSICLSPPALYKEYDLYLEKAPLFLKKYRNHVASGR